MGCNHCGCPTPRSRLCARCSRRQDMDSWAVDDETYECPECGGSTSGPDTVCYRCRTVGGRR